jgi:predicted ATPase
LADATQRLADALAEEAVVLLLRNGRTASTAATIGAANPARASLERNVRDRDQLNLARLWRDQDKCAEPRNLLVPIYGWFNEGFDTPDLKEAKALLDDLRE